MLGILPLAFFFFFFVRSVPEETLAFNRPNDRKGGPPLKWVLSKISLHHFGEKGSSPGRGQGRGTVDVRTLGSVVWSPRRRRVQGA